MIFHFRYFASLFDAIGTLERLAHFDEMLNTTFFLVPSLVFQNGEYIIIYPSSFYLANSDGLSRDLSSPST